MIIERPSNIHCTLKGATETLDKQWLTFNTLRTATMYTYKIQFFIRIIWHLSPKPTLYMVHEGEQYLIRKQMIPAEPRVPPNARAPTRPQRLAHARPHTHTSRRGRAPALDGAGRRPPADRSNLMSDIKATEYKLS